MFPGLSVSVLLLPYAAVALKGSFESSGEEKVQGYSSFPALVRSGLV